MADQASLAYPIHIATAAAITTPSFLATLARVCLYWGFLFSAFRFMNAEGALPLGKSFSGTDLSRKAHKGSFDHGQRRSGASQYANRTLRKQ